MTETKPQDRGGEQWMDFDTLQVPHDLGTVEYTPTQEMYGRTRVFLEVTGEKQTGDTVVVGKASMLG